MLFKGRTLFFINYELLIQMTMVQFFVNVRMTNWLCYTFFQMLFNNLTIAFNIVKLISTMFKTTQQCHDWFQQSCFVINKVTIRFNSWQMYKWFQQLQKLFNILLIEINKAPNTLQQSAYLSTMYTTNKQLIKILHQCCLKIEHYFL